MEIFFTLTFHFGHLSRPPPALPTTSLTTGAAVAFLTAAALGAALVVAGFDVAFVVALAAGFDEAFGLATESDCPPPKTVLQETHDS